MIKPPDVKKEDFSHLSINEQAQYVWNKGSFVDHRQCPNEEFLLYAIGRKFYEIAYGHEDDEILKVQEVDLDSVIEYYINKA